MRRAFMAAAMAAGVALGVGMPAAPAEAQHLRIALREDPDILDPTPARTFVGRIVFASLCDKLFDINERLEIVPQLATGHQWEDPRTLRITLREGVRFHDGTMLDAEAVRYTLNRHRTMEGSFRRTELAGAEGVEVVDPLTVRIRLREPSAAFLSQLTDRAGMIISPTAAEAAGRDFGRNPVCAGPFRFVERVAQDRIVVERFPDYWNPSVVHFDRITYLAIPDSTVRVANLLSGAVEMIQTVDPNAMDQIRRNNRFRLQLVDELGVQSIMFNLANGPRSDTPLGRDPRVREAFDLAIDRAALNQVVFNGIYSITAQPVPPASTYHARDLPPPGRDIARARALMAEAGVTTPLRVELLVPNNPELRQVGEVIQAMVREAGFDLRILAMEFASTLQVSTRGDFEAYLTAWSGRVDPDGNTWSFIHSTGPNNSGGYNSEEVDRLLSEARVELDLDRRRALYARIFRIAGSQDRARIWLWHRQNSVAYVARLQGHQNVPDGMIRVHGLRLN